MKALFVWLLLLAGGVASANDALVLISPERAGPIVDERYLVHGEWILWPSESFAGSGSRVMSLLTGLDWDGRGNELLFEERYGHWLSAAFESLRDRGYFAARDHVVERPALALAGRGSVPDPIATFLALSGNSPEPSQITMDDPWPANALLVAQVDNWDRVAAISAKAGGRVLVIEYPPPQGKRWSRAWLRGNGWPSGLPTWRAFDVPGLIPASEAGNLLLHLRSFDWRANDTARQGGANRWLAFVGYASPLTLSILAFTAMFFAGCTVYLTSIEERARVAGTVLKYLTLLPATVLMAGSLTRVIGYDWAALWIMGCFVTLVLASQMLGAVFGRAFPRAHPMLGIATVGFVACIASSPLWSMYSNVLNVNVLPIAPEAAGALLAYLVGVCVLSRGGGTVAWLGRSLAVATFAWGAASPAWWVSGQWPFLVLPLVAVVVGEGWFRIWMLPVFALLPLADLTVIKHGVVWAPGNLFGSATDAQALNVARHAEFLLSFGFLSTAIIAGGVAVFVERYFFQELRRTLVRDSRVKALFHASYACGAMGLFQPLMLYPALMCFVGGSFVLLSDAARAA